MSCNSDPTETTPLQNNNLSETLKNNQNFKMSDSKRILIKIGIDLGVLCCVGFPILIFFMIGEPYERGFFCDDESLMHPFHESTVKSWMLYIIGLVLPCTLILITESVQSKLNKGRSKQLRVGSWDIPPWIVSSYRQIGIFGFGAACSQLTTDIAKYSIGRLRPHFMTLCQPLINGKNCSDPSNLGRYIELFTCQGEANVTTRLLKEMRLSFPSGHSSFSAYTMIYCAIYLQSRMTWKGSKLVRHFLQFLMISLAWYTALSRISDYKHHWSDVLAGSTLGVFCAMIVSNFVADLFVKKDTKEIQVPQPRYELASSPGHNGHV